MGRRSKKKHRTSVELAGAYGVDILRFGDDPVTYELIFALWLSKEDEFFKNCLSVTAGIGAAFGGKIPEEWLMAFVDKDEAKEMTQKQDAQVEAMMLKREKMQPVGELKGFEETRRD